VPDRELNDLMSFGHAIEVRPDGTITDSAEQAAESVYVYLDADGQIESRTPTIDMAGWKGWELLTGYSGQQGCRGPIMHTSESIGGGLEGHIRATPGHYVAVTVEGLSRTENDDATCGWAVAYKPPA
jgi:hypothetical protein